MSGIAPTAYAQSLAGVSKVPAYTTAFQASRRTRRMTSVGIRVGSRGSEIARRGWLRPCEVRHFTCRAKPSSSRRTISRENPRTARWQGGSQLERGPSQTGCAQVSRQICAVGSDAGPPRNPLIRRSNPIRKPNQRYCGLLWIRRLKVRILPPQPPPIAMATCSESLTFEVAWEWRNQPVSGLNINQVVDVWRSHQA
jgi:hypothetical protein